MANRNYVELERLGRCSPFWGINGTGPTISCGHWHSAFALGSGRSTFGPLYACGLDLDDYFRTYASDEDGWHRRDFDLPNARLFFTHVLGWSVGLADFVQDSAALQDCEPFGDSYRWWGPPLDHEMLIEIVSAHDSGGEHDSAKFNTLVDEVRRGRHKLHDAIGDVPLERMEEVRGRTYSGLTGIDVDDVRSASWKVLRLVQFASLALFWAHVDGFSTVTVSVI